jgi:hypothetical protein
MAVCLAVLARSSGSFGNKHIPGTERFREAYIVPFGVSRISHDFHLFAYGC